MTEPSISIIVPVYNAEKYVPRCLESLINQTFQDIEIICVNDGSTDASSSICEMYVERDKRIILLSQENQGLSAARNAGLLQARGPYIQFCDSDDYYMPKMCEIMYNAMVSSDADLSVSGTEIIYDHVPSIPSDSNYYSMKYYGLHPVNIDVVRNTNVASWNKMFKKKIIDEYEIRYPVGLLYEDACFFMKYILVSRTIFFIHDCLYGHLRRNSSIIFDTFKKTPLALDHVRILKDVKDYMAKHHLQGAYETDIFLWVVLAYVKFVFKHGVESVYESAAAIASELLADIPDAFIQDYPYVSIDNVQKLAALKNNNMKAFICPNTSIFTRMKSNKFISVLFPPQTKRRFFLKKIVRRLMGF